MKNSWNRFHCVLYGGVALCIGGAILLGVLSGTLNEGTIPHLLGRKTQAERGLFREYTNFVDQTRIAIVHSTNPEQNDPKLIPEGTSTDSIQSWCKPEIYQVSSFGYSVPSNSWAWAKSRFPHVLSETDPWGNKIHLEVTYLPEIAVYYEDGSILVVTSVDEIKKIKNNKITRIFDDREYTIRIWSAGINRRDENGNGDDIVAQFKSGGFYTISPESLP